MDKDEPTSKSMFSRQNDHRLILMFLTYWLIDYLPPPPLALGQLFAPDVEQWFWLRLQVESSYRRLHHALAGGFCSCWCFIHQPEPRGVKAESSSLLFLCWYQSGRRCLRLDAATTGGRVQDPSATPPPSWFIVSRSGAAGRKRTPPNPL